MHTTSMEDKINERDARIFIKMLSESKDIETAKQEANDETGINQDIETQFITNLVYQGDEE